MGGAEIVEYEDGLYFVLSRGNERNDIFRDDHEWRAFLDVNGEMAAFAFEAGCVDNFRNAEKECHVF
ncbi:MAG: hypothetical protein WC202_05050 [Desulfobacterales bacterium]|jgi:hypothetical protein